MHRKFIGIIIAAALAVTTIGNAPARADEKLLGALAAIVGIAVVGKVIHDRNQRKRVEPATRNAVKAPPVHRNNRVYDLKPRALPQRANRKLLPGDCLRSADTRQGRVRYFAQRCLERNFRHADRLPQDCAIRLRGQSRHKRGYDARCLRDEGYQLARR